MTDEERAEEARWIQSLAYEGRSMQSMQRETGRSRAFILRVLADVGFLPCNLPEAK